jgi:hypothetical protein
MSLTITGPQAGLGQAIKSTIDMEVNGDDSRMKMSGLGAVMPDMEIIIKNGVFYMGAEGEWMAFDTEGMLDKDNLRSTNASQMQAVLGDASGVQSLGKRSVRGVECEILGFTVPPEKLWDLAALSGKQTVSGVQVSHFNGEVALGLADGLMRQMLMEMSMSEMGKPASALDMSIEMTLWDVNAPGVVIEAPKGAKSLGDLGDLGRSLPLQ